MSTRGRLTTSYAFLLFGTIIVFAIALAFGRRNQADDALVAEALRASESIVTAIRRAHADSQLTVLDTALASPVVRPTPALLSLLNRTPGYFMVFTSQGNLLFASQLVRELTPDEQTELIK